MRAQQVPKPGGPPSPWPGLIIVLVTVTAVVVAAVMGVLVTHGIQHDRKTPGSASSPMGGPEY